jgi:hypothetical protein
MTLEPRAKARRSLGRLRTMVASRPQTMLPHLRQSILAWVDELETGLEAKENPIRTGDSDEPEAA